jgi:hypothetical protein
MRICWCVSCSPVYKLQMKPDVGISASVKCLTSPWPLVASLSLSFGGDSVESVGIGLVQQATRKFLCKRNKRRDPHATAMPSRAAHAYGWIRLVDWLGMRAWLHTYKDIIVSSVLYGCEAWPLTLGDEHKVKSRVFWSSCKEMELGVKRPGREADHSPPPNAEAKYGGAMPQFPRSSSWRHAELIKRGESCIFYVYQQIERMYIPAWHVRVKYVECYSLCW